MYKIFQDEQFYTNGIQKKFKLSIPVSVMF